MTTPSGTQVSPEMQRVLDGITGLAGIPDSKFKPLADIAGVYPQCTWFNGCYYCKYSEFGPWHLQYCIA